MTALHFRVGGGGWPVRTRCLVGAAAASPTKRASTGWYAPKTPHSWHRAQTGKGPSAVGFFFAFFAGWGALVDSLVGVSLVRSVHLFSAKRPALAVLLAASVLRGPMWDQTS